LLTNKRTYPLIEGLTPPPPPPPTTTTTTTTTTKIREERYSERLLLGF
jgi:hypothetical protein